MWPTCSSEESIVNAVKRVGISATGVNIERMCSKVNFSVQKNLFKIANLLHPPQIVPFLLFLLNVCDLDLVNTISTNLKVQ